MKTVALYARVSSEKQAKQATVASQLAMLKERAQADGHIVLPSDVYVDEARRRFEGGGGASRTGARAGLGRWDAIPGRSGCEIMNHGG